MAFVIYWILSSRSTPTNLSAHNSIIIMITKSFVYDLFVIIIGMLVQVSNHKINANTLQDVLCSLRQSNGRFALAFALVQFHEICGGREIQYHVDYNYDRYPPVLTNVMLWLTLVGLAIVLAHHARRTKGHRLDWRCFGGARRAAADRLVLSRAGCLAFGRRLVDGINGNRAQQQRRHCGSVSMRI